MYLLISNVIMWYISINLSIVSIWQINQFLHKKGASGKPNARIDNTFSCDHGPRAPLRHCFSYVRELSRLRNITDFEATNEKRLMRRNYNFDDASNNSQSELKI